MSEAVHRRAFMASAAAASAGVSLASLAIAENPPKKPGARRPLVVASGNGMRTVERAMALIRQGFDPLDAAIAGVAIVEADPNDHSVGYGGLPNEEGVVELDAAVMHGPTHGGGAVASLRNIMHPAAVARLVMKRTKHVLMVGDGALKFAKAHGFAEVDLLTDDARKIWLRWKETRGASDDWLPAAAGAEEPAVLEALKGKRVTGTIHCSALDTHGDVGCVTTTSGLAWKIPGRVGDSPILGAGLYLDNTVGSCGSTGLGEVNLVNCSSFLVIENVRRGMHLKDAMIAACKRIAETTPRDPRFRDDKGRPNFGVTFYGLTKDGEFAGVNFRGPASMAVHDGETAKLVDCAVLYP